ncbi:MAG: thiamine pyrophosphate-binding protein, partial [Candidatus Promineifilaceae bacterium]|nr:thiamine pyrophosphate-binding protein [Candidatus Promineifilaceae bacterium]
SPIFVAAGPLGIDVVDVRDEATAVFAADAVSRLGDGVGVAAVTAGPGVTNTITAVKNAQLAHSPLVLLGGATATMLKGRGALQDIDQMALIRPHVKRATVVRRVREITSTLERAFAEAQSGVPGPVFVEFPVDLLYPEEMVREWYGTAGSGRGLRGWLQQWYLNRHVRRLFGGAWGAPAARPREVSYPRHSAAQVEKAVQELAVAERPVLLIGSQALLDASQAQALQGAVLRLGVPTFLSGMARGLLGREPLYLRHGRTKALKEADLILLAGVPCDFRLNYGRSLSRQATVISVNRSSRALRQNCRPNLASQADPGAFLRALGARWERGSAPWAGWLERLQARNAGREEQIAAQTQEETGYVNPLYLCQEIEARLPENSVLVGDGGDFVATASYIVRPRRPLSWLDPGPFGTLGVGAGFALGARLMRPEAEVWLLYGDGSAGYSLAEFDTFARHNLPVIAVVGTDGSWAQIAREQVEIFGDSVATELARTDYHIVAEGYGGEGLLVSKESEVGPCLDEAQRLAREGRPVLVNVLLGESDFRKGSISI